MPDDPPHELPADPGQIAAWQRLSPTITTSGRLTADDPAALAACGVRSVINLALADHPEALPEEAGRLAALGLAYRHIPVPFDAPGEDHFAAFVTALATLPRPVHVHCILNWRVSAFFCRYHRAVLGMPAEEALALMAVQWDPATTAHPAGPVWARFIAGGAPG